MRLVRYTEPALYDALADEYAASQDMLDRLDEAVHGLLFHDVAAGASPHATLGEQGLIVNRHDQHGQIGCVDAQRLDELQPRSLFQREIDDGEIEAVAPHRLKRRLRGIGLDDDREPRVRVNQAPHAETHHRMVVDDEDPRGGADVRGHQVGNAGSAKRWIPRLVEVC